MTENITTIDTWNIISLNINGIQNKIEELVEYIKLNNVDICLIQETHTTEEESIHIKNKMNKLGYDAIFANHSNEKMKKNYILKRKTKIESNKNISDTEKEKLKREINDNFYKKNGGVASIFKMDLFNQFNHISSEDKRTIISENTSLNNKWSIINLYVPTGNKKDTNNFFANNIKGIIKKMEKKTDKFIIGGDWNATINGQLDQWANHGNTNKITFLKLNEIISEFNLQDNWRN